jgi:hypothetical protein
LSDSASTYVTAYRKKDEVAAYIRKCPVQWQGTRTCTISSSDPCLATGAAFGRMKSSGATFPSTSLIADLWVTLEEATQVLCCTIIQSLNPARSSGILAQSSELLHGCAAQTSTPLDVFGFQVSTLMQRHAWFNHEKL